MYLCNATKNQRSIHTPAFQYYLLGLPHWLHQRHVALGLKAPIRGNLVQLFHLTAGNLAGFNQRFRFVGDIDGNMALVQSHQRKGELQG